jgi:hypothetical protein
LRSNVLFGNANAIRGRAQRRDPHGGTHFVRHERRIDR